MHLTRLERERVLGMHAHLDTRLGRSRSRNEEPGEPDDSKGSRSCTDADDHVALSVQRVVSADGAAQYVGTLTVDDGLPVKLTLFRRIVAVSGGHTEESAKLSAYNDCVRFCYYYNRLDPFADTGMKSDA